MIIPLWELRFYQWLILLLVIVATTGWVLYLRHRKSSFSSEKDIPPIPDKENRTHIKRLLGIRLIFSPVSVVLLLLAVSGIVMALDEYSNILNAKSLIPDSVGAIAFASFGFGCLLLFVLVRFCQRGKK